MKNLSFNRAISFILGLVILIQLFCAVPVTAEGNYQCTFTYNDASVNDPDGEGVYPNVEMPKNSHTIDVELDKTVEESGEDWPADPTRIIGKRFVGWFIKDKDIQITPNTKLTSNMITRTPNIIDVEGRWVADDCADIETAVLRSYDYLGNTLSTDLELLDASGNAIKFSPKTTEYYIKVLDNTVFTELDFHIYEPAATYEITYNDGYVDTTDTVTKTYSNAESKGSYTYKVGEGEAQTGGEATPAAAGMTVEVIPAPTNGYMVDTITVTGASGAAVEVTDNKFIMPEENVTISVNFKVIPKTEYTITANAVTDDTMGNYSYRIDYGTQISGGTSGTARAEKEVLISPEPAGGYMVDTITVTGESGAAVKVTDNKFIMPEEDVEISVSFKEIPEAEYTITANAATYGAYTYKVGDGDAQNDSATANATAGTVVEIIPAPAENYMVDIITVTGESGAVVEVTDNKFIMPEEDVEISVSFKEIPEANYTITAESRSAREFDSGIDVKMKRVALAEASDRKSNDIVITVKAKNGDTKTYTFHIERSSGQIKLAYGNTPFGRIAKDYSNEEKRQEKRDDFSSTYTFYGSTTAIQNKYDPKAWGVGEEVTSGAEAGEGQYRNYDKDETAIVAYIGSSFTDPGFTVYNASGEIVSLSESDTVKRTISYDTVPSYDFSDFKTTTSKTHEATLNGAEGENVISILKNKDEKVRPGVYTIRYEYGSDIFAERKLIVIPRPGDMNMDGYINSVDVSMYNRTDKPTEDTLSGRLYLYRGMDLTQDGVVDDDDADALKNRAESSVRVVYPDISVAETVTQEAYTPAAEIDSLKAQLYMEYLGENSDDITNSADNLPASAQENGQLEVGDIFWIGYRVDNVENIDALKDGVYSLTAAINYDSRYISPAVVLTESEAADVSESEQWLATLKKYNSIWDNYTYNGFTNSALAYTANNSTAVSNLDSAAEIKTLVMDITAGENPKTLASGNYILRVPFKVDIVPPEGRSVTDASLDANTFNMTTGIGGATTFEWDTKNALSNNLADVIDFRGAFSPAFGDEAEAESINEYAEDDYIYGDDFETPPLGGLVDKGGALEGDLPEGVRYDKTFNKLKGTPSEAGTFIFYINSKKLSLTISKAPMKVKAVDKTKMYGAENPELTLEYDESCIKKDVDKNGLESEGFKAGLVAPQMTCAADTATEFGETVPIIISGGSAKNYYFKEYTDGTLTVDQKRPIRVTAATNIPICTSEIAYKNEAPIAIEAAAQTDDNTLTAEGIINNDIIKVKYNAVYSDETGDKNVTPGDKNVTLQDFAVDEDYEDGKNYTIAVDQQPLISAGGKVLDKVLSGMGMNQKPEHMYTYGEKYSYGAGITNFVLSFDNTERITGLHLGNLGDYGIKINAVKDGNEVTDTIDENLKLTVPKHDGMVITLVPPEPQATDFGIRPITLDTIMVSKRDINVKADDKTKTYGDLNPELTFTYTNEEDFAYDENKDHRDFTAGLTAPVPMTAATQGSDVGTYMISLTGGSHDNYEFVKATGTLEITPRTIDIVSINEGIPGLTAKIIKETPDSAAVYEVPGSATRDQLTVDKAYGDDDFRITYTAVYAKNASGDNITVGIKDVEIDETYKKGKNYVLSSNVPTEATGGVVHEKNIESFTIVDQPKLKYTYGDTLDLNTGKVNIKYDDDSEDTNLTFAQLAGKKIELRYGRTGGAIKDAVVEGGVNVNVPDFDGNYMVLVADSIYKPANQNTNPFEINKATMNISVVNIESEYGEDPELKYEYKSTDFKNGENKDSESFAGTLVPPKIDSDASNTADVGEYDVKLSGGSSDNYEFTYTDGKHKITPRSIEVTKITGGVPLLTSDIIYQQPGNVHDLAASADMSQMEVTGRVNNDDIKIEYKARYESIEPSDSVTVKVVEPKLVDGYGKNKNYTLESVVATADGGKIYDKEITAVEITEQPKLEYTYGDTLNLNTGKVKITYDSGLVEEDLTFAELSSHRITLTYTNTDVTPANGEVLTVPYHNGKTITLTPTTVHTVTPPVTKSIKVEKKEINVTADSTTSVYGNGAQFSFKYTLGDFVNNETPESLVFKNELTPPVATCEVDGTSEVGEYTVTVSGGEATNYAFEYHTGTHTVTPRPIKVTRITGGVPPLTSDIIFEESGNVHDLAAWADLSRMEVTGRVNNDDIKIEYKARYESITPNDSVTVKVVEPKLADGYGENKNYTLESVVETADGGRISDKEITAVEITEQPKLEYTYGDTLNLNTGKVKITYDSGFVEENLTFAELSSHRITLTYTDTSDTPKNEEVLTVPYHNGKTITLTPTTIHTVTAPVTESIKVEKKTLTYGTHIVKSIVYDGSTTLTEGTVVLVGEENDNVPTATGVFNFEDYLAGENKVVYVTDIKLDDQAELNYQLAADNSTATGTIEKAATEAQLSAENVVLSEENIITITAPEMTQIQIDGGAEYEYSIDGGQTWAKSNVFENLALRLDCSVCIRFAETSNFKESQPTEPIALKTYLNKITLISYDDMSVLKSFFTNVERLKSAAELKQLIGDVGVIYYEYYVDQAGKNDVRFPFTPEGDTTIYTSLKRPKDSSNRGNVFPLKNNPPEESDVTMEMMNPFTDVGEADWFYDAVMYVYENQLMNGLSATGFAPADILTRAMMVTVLHRAEGEPIAGGGVSFEDVVADAYYADAVAWGQQNGIIKGYSETEFAPNAFITREQIAAIMHRYAGYKGYDVSVGENTNILSYDDFADISEYAIVPMQYAVGSGLMKGRTETTLNPKDNTTRAEIATILQRFIEGN